MQLHMLHKLDFATYEGGVGIHVKSSVAKYWEMQTYMYIFS